MRKPESCKRGASVQLRMSAIPHASHGILKRVGDPGIEGMVMSRRSFGAFLASNTIYFDGALKCLAIWMSPIFRSLEILSLNLRSPFKSSMYPGNLLKTAARWKSALGRTRRTRANGALYQRVGFTVGKFAEFSGRIKRADVRCSFTIIASSWTTRARYDFFDRNSQ